VNSPLCNQVETAEQLEAVITASKNIVRHAGREIRDLEKATNKLHARKAEWIGIEQRAKQDLTRAEGLLSESSKDGRAAQSAPSGVCTGSACTPTTVVSPPQMTSDAGSADRAPVLSLDL